MKYVVVILFVIAVVFGFSFATGVQQYSYTTGYGATVVYHTIGGRLQLLVGAILFGFMGYGCAKRRAWGWWSVAFVLSLMLVVGVPWVVWQLVGIDLPLGAKILGGFGEAAKVAFIAWLLFGFWLKRRKEFGVRKKGEP